MEATEIEEKETEMPLKFEQDLERIWKNFLSSKNIITKDMTIAWTEYHKDYLT